jgi:hypothetical protein
LEDRILNIINYKFRSGAFAGWEMIKKIFIENRTEKLGDNLGIVGDTINYKEKKL